MPNEKRLEFEYDSGESLEVLVLHPTGTTGTVLDDTDGEFRAAPAISKVPVLEHTVANGFFMDILGTYVLLESRAAWPDGFISWKANLVGSTTVIRSGSLVINNDAESVPATASILAICNNAILALGGNTIAALDLTTAEGILCTNFWSQAVDAVLRLHPWNCAIKRQTLTADVTAPVYEWASAFSLPSDLIRLLDIEDVTSYKVEGRKILSDETTINVRFVYRSVDPLTWDSLFIEAMTAYMQFKLAYPLTKSNTTRGEQWKLFTELLRTAKAVDAQEEPGDTIGDFPFINVRG